MKKIVMILMTTLISLLMVSCAITSGMSKDVNIKEYKLNRLSYVKKICQITDAYESEDFVAYELDNGTFKPVGALIATQEVETVEDVRHFLNYVANRFLGGRGSR